MSLYVYSCGPIDFWYGWHPLRELLIQDTSDNMEHSEIPRPAEVLDRWERAQVLARLVDWEGDIRTGPFWIPLPCETGEWDYAIGWKQNNNGTTFIASPFQMTWLHDDGLMVNERGIVVNLYARRHGSRSSFK